MDDCTLKSLAVKPGKLLPSFKKGITEYNLTVGSQVDSVTFDCETSDRGASYSISGSGGGKSVKLNVGELNNIKIEVTAEDGTTKAYWIHTKRLSAKDAALAGIEIKGAVLDPSFAPNVFEYFGVLPCNTSSVSVIPMLDDPKASIKVNGGKPGSAVPLNVGQTVINVEVTSPDGSKVQLYTMFLIRKQIPLFVRFADADLSFKYECPVSLAPMYQPVTVKGSQPIHTYSGPIIDSFTRTSRVDPIGEQTLEPDWRLPNYELDKEMSEALVAVPLISGGLTEKVKFTDLGSHLKDFNFTPKLQAEKSKFEKNSALLAHTVEVRVWEKQLQQIFDVTDAVQLEALSDDAVEKYFTSLPDVGQVLPTYREGQSPADYLDRSLICLASAIEAGKTKNPKNAGLHLKLGMILEEKVHLEDVIGLRKEKLTGAAGMDVAARESSKAEECDAICHLRGLPANATAAAQLKAIDEEYHSLLEKGQSFKADHVQALYAWKSKQAAKDGGGGSGGYGSTQKTVGENTLVNQAYLKYLDALSLDDTKAVHHFHVGRMLVVLGEYDKAIPRQFYLGVALVLKKDGPGNRTKDSLAYLLKGFELLLRSGIDKALKPETTREKKLSAENLLCFSNVCLLQGLIHLGQLVSSTNSSGLECVSAVDIWHNVAILASIALTTVARGNTYRKLEQVLMDAHSLLLQKLLETSKENVTLIGARCERLSAIIRRSSIPPNAQLLQLQLKTSQTLARIQPCSSYALCLLGNAQLASYDFEPNSSGAKDLLSDSKNSFLASIVMEGRSCSGEPLPQVTDQKWWQEKGTQSKPNVEQSSGPGKVPASSTPGKLPLSVPGKVPINAVPSKVPAAAGRGGAKVSTPGPGKVSPKTSATSLTGPALKGKAAVTPGGGAGKGVGRGGASSSGKTSVVLGKGPGKTAAPISSTTSAMPASAVAVAPKTEAKSEPETRPAAESAITTTVVNQASFHPRLGLARALSRGAKDLSEAKKYYLEAISMAPQEHSAYIEVAELLTETDPLGAVDVYCKFPVPPNPTFNDAYIFGEIVRLLFKAEKYDDPRLLSNMIALGRIMGLASLEKYVETLQKKFKTEFLKHLYAGVNGKEVDDPMMQQFFKIKCWI